ncbi:MAG: tyrosine-protein phosphatase [Eubacteriales bacterium]
MIDFHSHILYGIDDGSKSIEESIKMIERAEQIGFKQILATPHYISNSKFNSGYFDNLKLLERLKYRTMLNGIDANLLLGNEVFFETDLIEKLENNLAATLNETKYILLETPRTKVIFEHLLSFIFELQVKGFVIVLAHPERYDFVIDDPAKLIILIERDVFVQLNLLSLIGIYGKEIKETSKVLLDHNMVHFIGSDAHNLKYYNNAEDALRVLHDTVGDLYFSHITQSNPQMALDGELFYPDEPVPFTKKKLFGFLKKKANN